jgi:hypothetical protein
LFNFAQNVLPNIAQSFVLVSGDSDIPINDAMLAEPLISSLIGNGYLQSWYAQNLCVQHEKLVALPIGLDYHTMWERPGLWGMTAISPIAQEHALLATHANSPDFNHRYLAAYCNWHFAIGRGDRQTCFDKIDKSICFFEAGTVPRQSSWARQAECMFVVSPEGVGVDCHRTWEALMLGCVPIVKRNAICALFEKLPVMLVDDWSEVNTQTLLAYIQKLATEQFDYSPLFGEYWRRHMNGEDTNLLKPMSHSEFRRLLTRRTG